jgi:hypothetical protein
MSHADKTRENRLRRMAARQNSQLVKVRRRDPRAWDYGTYHLIVDGGLSMRNASLDQIEARLTGVETLRAEQD